MKYNKLVRDRIPEIIKEKGQVPLYHIAENEEFWEKLKEKLTEEVEEFLKTSSNEELGDVLEVVKEICEFRDIDQNELETVRKKKAEERGVFKKRIILDEIIDKKKNSFADKDDNYSRMKIPDFNLEELKKAKEENFKTRLEFIDKYVEWLKKTPNKEWSTQQRALIDR